MSLGEKPPPGGRCLLDAGLEFLLILSALLSAVTGAFGGVRAPDVQPRHSAASQAIAAEAAPRTVSPIRIAAAIGPAAGFPDPGLPLPEIRSFAVSLPAPLETVRLLE